MTLFLGSIASSNSAAMALTNSFSTFSLRFRLGMAGIRIRTLMVGSMASVDLSPASRIRSTTATHRNGAFSRQMLGLKIGGCSPTACNGSNSPSLVDRKRTIAFGFCSNQSRSCRTALLISRSRVDWIMPLAARLDEVRLSSGCHCPTFNLSSRVMDRRVHPYFDAGHVLL